MVIFKSKREADKYKDEFINKADEIVANKLLIGDIKTDDFGYMPLIDNLSYNPDTKRYRLTYNNMSFKSNQYGTSVEFYVPNWLDVYVEFKNVGFANARRECYKSILPMGEYSFVKVKRGYNILRLSSFHINLDKLEADEEWNEKHSYTTFINDSYQFVNAYTNVKFTMIADKQYRKNVHFLESDAVVKELFYYLQFNSNLMPENIEVNTRLLAIKNLLTRPISSAYRIVMQTMYVEKGIGQVVKLEVPKTLRKADIDCINDFFGKGYVTKESQLTLQLMSDLLDKVDILSYFYKSFDGENLIIQLKNTNTEFRIILKD